MRVLVCKRNGQENRKIRGNRRVVCIFQNGKVGFFGSKGRHFHPDRCRQTMLLPALNCQKIRSVLFNSSSVLFGNSP